ncbi:MAG TPA: CdvA-like protein [Candidatus Bathyarchaeia archaeon]
MISWKHSFNRLNEEYNIAKKKQQALENLYQSGKISQSTRDAYNNDISQAINEIERQQSDLLQKMDLKVTELQSQIKTLEMLLANYEIQHVVGEVDETTYEREITLLNSALDAAKHELDKIKDAATQLCSPMQAPAPTVESVQTVIEADPAPQPEPTPIQSTENVQIAPPEPEVIPAICTPDPVAASVEQVLEQAEPDASVVPSAETVATENTVTNENPPEIQPTIEASSETVVESAAPIEEQPEVATDTFEISVETVVETTAPAETDAETIIEPPADAPLESTEEMPSETPIEAPSETIIENNEIIVENDESAESLEPEIAPVEVVSEEIIQPIEEAVHEAHPTEAPKEAHPEVTAEVATEAQDAEESQTVTEVSQEENSEDQSS